MEVENGLRAMTLDTILLYTQGQIFKKTKKHKPSGNDAQVMLCSHSDKKSDKVSKVSGSSLFCFISEFSISHAQ